MIKFRTYGSGPVRIVIIHGGPGAPGEMAPVARELSAEYGILEPMQTAVTVEDQVEELADIIRSKGDPPVILVGYSWGAWLSCMVTARYPRLVKKLILISAGPFEEKYATVWQNRMSRLNMEERQEVKNLLQQMDDPVCTRRDDLLAAFGEFMRKTDSYRPILYAPAPADQIPCDHELHVRIWEEAAEMRRNGRLLDLCRQISCQVTAIHGDYDPHPATGVRESLAPILSVFRFILLEKCGHCPWIEEEARDRFYTVLRGELSDDLPGHASG